MKKLRKNGFTMMEALLSLLVSLLVSSLVCMVLSVFSHLLQMERFSQDQFAVLQLRQLCSLASVSLEQDWLVLEINHEKMEISYHNHRLVKREGYEILLEDIDYAHFSQEGNSIFLEFKKQGQVFFYQII